MDEKLIGLAAAIGAGTVLGRRLRPVARVAMKGVVVLTEAGAGAVEGVTGMYNEAKAEYRAGRASAVGATAPATAAPPAAEPPAPAAPRRGSRSGGAEQAGA